MSDRVKPLHEWPAIPGLHWVVQDDDYDIAEWTRSGWLRIGDDVPRDLSRLGYRYIGPAFPPGEPTDAEVERVALDMFHAVGHEQWDTCDPRVKADFRTMARVAIAALRGKQGTDQ